MGNNVLAQGMVLDLVNQFSDTLAFYRELIQNAIDAGSNRIDVSLEYVPGPPGAQGLAIVRVEDDGSGMDEDIIDNYLLVLFRSSKENDLTKIGKFGVGFLSVFALKPSLVRIYTSKNQESWRVDFPDYRSYNKYKMPDPRDGTLVEIHKRMSPQEYAVLAEKSLATIRYWCRHADTHIFFSDREKGGPPLPVNEPFTLPGGESLRYSEEGTEVVLAFSPPEIVRSGDRVLYSGEDKPFYGFYNRGLTLKEGRKVFIPGVELKMKSRYLEHTITRDNVMEDDNYLKAMGIIKRLGAKELPKKVRAELEAVAQRLSAAAALNDFAAIKELEFEWERRKTFLKFLCGSLLSGFRHDFGKWKIIPAVTGLPVSMDDLETARKKLVSEGILWPAGSAEKQPYGYLSAKKADAITRALAALGAPVVLEMEACRFFMAWVGGESEPMPVSELILAEKAEQVDPGMAAFLKDLAILGETCGGDYACVYPARFIHEDPAVSQQPFIFKKNPYGVGHKGEVVLFKGKARLCPMINCSHGSVRSLAALHASRPGFAAFLMLKSMLLHYEEKVECSSRSGGTNLSEKMERRLLKAAISLDLAGGRNG